MKLNDFLSEAPQSKSSPYQPKLKPWMYQTKPEIEQWIKDAKIEAQISKELEVHPTRGELQLGNFFSSGPKESLIEYKGKHLLPVQFNMCGVLRSDHLAFESMEGLPHVVLKYMRLSDCAIENFVGCPKHIGGDDGSNYDIQIESTKIINSFVGCPPVQSMDIISPVSSIEGIPDTIIKLHLDSFSDMDALRIACPNLELLILTEVEPGVNDFKPLSVFFMKKLRQFYISSNGYGPSKVVKEFNNIVNKNLAMKKNALHCQRDLIAASREMPELLKYAKL
jgi:hypothetical protein